MSIGTMRVIAAIVGVVLTWIVLMLVGAALDPVARVGVAYLSDNFGAAGNIAALIVIFGGLGWFVLHRRRIDADAQFARDRTIHVDQAKPWSYYAKLVALAVGPFIIGALLTISLRP